MELSASKESSIDLAVGQTVVNPFRNVQARYVTAISNQVKRRNRQNRENFTANENAAIMYYGMAAQQLEALRG